jgi:endogenous inhibitor of DNA gyrase (YacG/DUF329 family)
MAMCPICSKKAAARSANPAFPFCSARCKAVDLGKWLNEEYRIPVGPLSDPDDLEEAQREAEGAPVSPRDMRN